MNFASRFLRIGLVFWLCCRGFLPIQAAESDLPPPGWTIVDLPQTDKLRTYGPPLVVNDVYVATRLFNEGVALVNQITGATTPLGGPKFVSGTEVKMCVMSSKLVVVSGSRTSTNLNKVTLDIYDLSSGTWSVPISREVENGAADGNYQQYGLTAAVYQDEFRVITTAGDILRWKASDFSPLPTVVFPHSYNQKMTWEHVGVQFGDDYCIGIAPNRSGLVMENAGLVRTVVFPAGVTTSGVLSVSSRYLILTTSHSVKGNRVLALDRSMPAAEPVFLPKFNGNPIPSYSVWGEHYLVAVVPDGRAPLGWKLQVTDLYNPAGQAVEISLPPGVTPTGGIISAGAFLKLGEKFWRLPVFPGTALVGVSISDAKASESDGELRFKVSADRPLVQPVTVKLRTRSGMAEEAVDYVGLEKTVTLTAANPTADVVVRIVQDSFRESGESMILEAVDIDGAWKSRGYGVGIISDTGFGGRVDLPPLPGVSESGKFSDDWAITALGMLAKSSISESEAGYFLLRGGSNTWERVNSLGPYDRSLLTRILDVRGSVVCVAVQNDPHIYPLIEGVVVDIASDQLIRTTGFGTFQAVIGDDGVLHHATDQPRYGVFFRFQHPEDSWYSQLSFSATRPIRRYSEDAFMYSDDSGHLTLKSLADGSDAGMLAGDYRHERLGPITAEGKFWVAKATNYLEEGTGDYMVGNRTGKGLPFIQTSSGTSLPANFEAEVTEDGIGFIPANQSNGVYTTAMVDCLTGGVLGTIESSRMIGPLSWANGTLAIETPGNKLSLLRMGQGFPVPKELSFKRGESGDSKPWLLELTNSVDFEMSARIVSSSPDIKATVQATIAPGQRTIQFPATIKDDSIPEWGENISITLELTGNGRTEEHPIKVDIPANDFTYIEKPDPKDLIEASSIAIHSSGVMIGTEFDQAAADARYEKLYVPDNNSPFFGRTVAINADYVAIGAPVVRRNFSRGYGNFVSIYSRKSGKLHRHIDRSQLFHCAFGAVLRFEGDRLLVGAPGIDRKGFVTVMSLAGEKDLVFKQPKPSGTNDGFGSAIASRGDSVWISAPRAGSGKVYQFSLKSGKLVRILSPSGSGYLNFGVSLEIIGLKLAVGAPQKEGMSAVFLFSQSNGTLVEEIGSPFEDGGYFGASLAVLEGKVLVVGCPASHFSPAGALVFYRTSTGKSKMMNVLLPPKRASGVGHSQIFGGLGSVGGLSAAEDVLGIATGAVPDPISLFTGKKGARSNINPFHVAILSPSKSAAIPLSAARAVIQPNHQDPWERALGPGATAADCAISVGRSGMTVTVGLPVVPSFNPGARLVLETSEDLAGWRSVAVLLGGTPGNWTSSDASVVIEGASARLAIEGDARARYFRIRCEAP